jgi:hypothetical protein
LITRTSEGAARHARAVALIGRLTERETNMSANGSWVIGHNVAGYLPNPDVTHAYADRSDAATALADLMRDYADADDSETAEMLPNDPVTARAHGYTVTGDGVDYGDDEPSMRAEADAVLADDGPGRVPGDWSASLLDGSGHRAEFRLMWSAGRSADTDL